MKDPCDQCPWRVANHGKRHRHGFYTKRNLTRLWNQIRKGGGVQTCHPTDPGHPDHGAKPDSTPTECAGSVILVTRELRFAANLGGEPDTLEPGDIDAYLADHADRRGLTMSGFRYFCWARNVPRPVGKGDPLPTVSVEQLDSPEFGRV